MIDILLSAGIDLNQGNKFGRTPLHEAVIIADIELVKLLVSKGAIVNTVDVNRMTPLIDAVANADLEMFDELVKMGANVTARNVDESNLIHLACGSVSFLIQYTDCLRVRSPDVHQAKKNAKRLIEKLMATGLFNINDTNNKGNTALHEAYFHGSYELVKMLISLGADTNALNNDGFKPIDMKTGKWSHQKITDEEFTFINDTLLGLRYNIDRDVIVNYSNELSETLFHLLVRRMNIDHKIDYHRVIKILLKAGLDIDKVDCFGQTALHKAVISNNLGLVKELLLHGPWVDVVDINGRTPLIDAVYNANVKIFDELVRCHADLTIKNVNGENLLHIASRTNKTDDMKQAALSIAEQVLSTGLVDLNCADTMGVTPLHVAVQNNFVEMIDLLATHGANFNIVSVDKFIPADMTDDVKVKEYVMSHRTVSLVELMA